MAGSGRLPNDQRLGAGRRLPNRLRRSERPNRRLKRKARSQGTSFPHTKQDNRQAFFWDTREGDFCNFSRGCQNYFRGKSTFFWTRVWTGKIFADDQISVCVASKL